MSLQFLITAFVVVLAPGTGVIYTLAIGLGQGARPAAWAALGCTFGIVPHLLAATLGLAAVLHSSALAFQIVKFAGVAYLLYLAWQAWKNREGGPAEEAVVADADAFRIDPVENEDFSRAVIETMALAAHADGNIDADEMEAIDKALKDAGADISMLGASADKAQTLEDIVVAAKTPNHAAQLYAAACVATGETSGEEGDFLADLADRLAIHPRTAAAIRDQAVKA